MNYEALFIINALAEKIDTTIEKINFILEEEKCKITNKENKGIKKLAYPINGETKGCYYLVNFTTNSKIHKIEERINTIDDVFKYIIINIEKN